MQQHQFGIIAIGIIGLGTYSTELSQEVSSHEDCWMQNTRQGCQYGKVGFGQQVLAHETAQV